MDMDMDTLYTAAIAGNTKAKATLALEADRLTEYDETILHIASEDGNKERVEFIVREFAKMNLLVKVTKHNHTALHLAAYCGHTAVAKVLINAARDLPPSANDDSHNPVSSFQDFLRQGDLDMDTALHAAVMYGHMAIVKLLVEADPSDGHSQNNEGKTPMYIAAEKGYNDIIKEICTICTAPSLGGPGGSTALHAAILNIHKEQEEDETRNLWEERDREVIMMLINAGKSSSNPDPASEESFEAFFNKTDEDNRTVLELAVELNHVDLVELILKEDPAYRRGNKKNNLMHLIKKAIDEDHMNIVKLLSKNNRARVKPEHKGAVDLFLAMKKLEKESVFRLLRDNKHLINFVDEEGWTPLHYAAYHEFDSILEKLTVMQMECGNFSLFLPKEGVSTPFHLAAENGYTSTVILLLQIWPGPPAWAYTAVNKNGQNILHLAAVKNDKEMIRQILEHCPKDLKDEIVNMGDEEGNTPLHILASNGCFCPELMKHKGLDTKRQNKQKWTPRDMLYLDNINVLADQVRIKIALDNIESSESGKFRMKFWEKGLKEIKHTSEVVASSTRARKDAKFNTIRKSLTDEKYSKKKKDLEPYKNRTNTQIIVTALITTVTFTVGFTMPGGLRQSEQKDEGSAVLSKKKAFNACMVSDALALLLSTSSLFFYFLQSMNDDLHQVSILNAASTVLNIFSIIAMMLTFITGTYVVLFHSQTLAITICTIGSLFFLLLIIVLTIKVVHDCLVVKRNID